MLYAISAYVPVLWHMRGGSLNAGAALITVLMVVGLIGNLAGGRMGDNMGRRRIVGLAMILAVLAMAGFF